jgi:hypothetical protein
VDRRVKTRSDLPGGAPFYILIGMIGFLNVTTTEKTGLLLIEVFRKHFNLQNYGHLDRLLVAFLICQNKYYFANMGF